MVLLVIFCLKFLSLHFASAENSISHNYPFLVRIYFKHATQDDSHCGGVIVDKDLILTSAQCCTVVGDAYVVYGDTNHTDYVNGRNMGRYHEWGVAGKMLHDGYQELPDGAHVHDVCLMKLNKELPDGDGHGTIDLPTGKLSAVSNCIVPGWGNLLNDTMQHVLEVETVFPKECQDGSSLCVRLEANCRGDGGNPIVCEDSTGKKIVCGVDSYYLYAAGSDMTCDDIEANYFVNLYKEKDFLDRHVRSAPHSMLVLSDGGQSKEKVTAKWTDITVARVADKKEPSAVTFPEGDEENEKETGKWTDLSTVRGADELEISTVTFPEAGKDDEKETGKWTDLSTVRGADEPEISTVTFPEAGKDDEKETRKWTDLSTIRGADEMDISTVTFPEAGKDDEKETGKWTDLSTVRGADEPDISTVTFPEAGKDDEKETRKWTDLSTIRGADEMDISTVTFPEAGKDDEKETGKWTDVTAVKGVEEPEISTVTFPEAGKDDEKETGKWTDKTTATVGLSTVDNLVGSTDKEKEEAREEGSYKSTEKIFETSTSVETGQEENISLLTSTSGAGGDIKQQFVGTTEKGPGQETYGDELIKTTEPGEYKTTLSRQKFTGNVVDTGTQQEYEGKTEKDWSETRLTTVDTEEKATESLGTEVIERDTEESVFQGTKVNTEKILSGTIAGDVGKETEVASDGATVEATRKTGDESGNELTFGRETEKTVFEAGQTTKSYLSEEEGSGGDSRGTSPQEGGTKVVQEVGTEILPLGTGVPSIQGGTSYYEQVSTLVSDKEFGEGTNTEAQTVSSKGLLVSSDEVLDVGSTVFWSGAGLDKTTLQVESVETEKAPPFGSDVTEHNEYETTLKVDGKGTESVESEYDDGSGLFSGDGSGNTLEIGKTTEKKWIKTTVKENEKVTGKTGDDYDESTGKEIATEWKDTTVVLDTQTSKKPKIPSQQETTVRGKETENWQDTVGTENVIGFVSKEPEKDSGKGSEEHLTKATPKELGEGSGDESGLGSVEETETESEGVSAMPEHPGSGYGSGEGSGVRPEEGPFESTDMGFSTENEKVTDGFSQGPDEYIEQIHTEGSGSKPEQHLPGTTRKTWKITTRIPQEGDAEKTPEEYDVGVEQSYTEGSGDVQKPHPRKTTRKKWQMTTAKINVGGTENIPEEYDEDVEQSYTEGSGGTWKPHPRKTTRKKWQMTTAKIQGEGTENIPEEYDEDIEQSYTEGSGGTQKPHSRKTTRKKSQVTTAKIHGDGTENILDEYDEDIEQSYTEGSGGAWKPHPRKTTRKKWQMTTDKLQGEGTENIPEEYDEDIEQSYTEGSGGAWKPHSRKTTKKKWKITTDKLQGEGTENVPEEYDEDIEQSYTEGSGGTQKPHPRKTTKKKWQITTAKIHGGGTENIVGEYDLNTVEGIGGKVTQTTVRGKFSKKPKIPAQQMTTNKSLGKEQGEGTESEGGLVTESEKEYGSGGFEDEIKEDHGGDVFDDEIQAGTIGTTAKKGKHEFMWGATGSGVGTMAKQSVVPLGVGMTSTVFPKRKLPKTHISSSGPRMSTKTHLKVTVTTPKSFHSHSFKGQFSRLSASVTPFSKGGSRGSTYWPVRGDEGGGGGGGKGRGPSRSPSAKARAMIRYEQYYDDDERSRYSGTHKFSPSFIVVFVASVLILIA